MEADKLNILKEYQSRKNQRFIPSLDIDTTTINPSTHLCTLLLQIFEDVQTTQILNISIDQLIYFILSIQSTYDSTMNVPYHRFEHAVDVVCIVHFIIQNCLQSSILTNIEKIILLIAALCHDSGHVGLNNLFHINCRSDIAILTGEESVLEVYSVALCQKYIKQYDLFENLDKETTQYCYDAINEMILATDMKYHYGIQEILNNYVNDSVNSINDRNKLLMCAILHCADISNPTRQFPIAKKWSDLISKEFFMQGDLEQYLQIQVSPNMERPKLSQKSNITMNGSQVQELTQKMYAEKQLEVALGFGDYIVGPFFEILYKFILKLQNENSNNFQVFLNGLKTNRTEWINLNQGTLQLNVPQSSSPSHSSESEINSEEQNKNITSIIRRMSVASGVIIVNEKLRTSSSQSLKSMTKMSRDSTRSSLKLSFGSKLSGLSQSLNSITSRVSSIANIKSRRSSANQQESDITEKAKFLRQKKLYAVASGVQLFDKPNPQIDSQFVSTSEQLQQRIKSLPRLNQPNGILYKITSSRKQDSSLKGQMYHKFIQSLGSPQGISLLPSSQALRRKSGDNSNRMQIIPEIDDNDHLNDVKLNEIIAKNAHLKKAFSNENFEKHLVDIGFLMSHVDISDKKYQSSKPFERRRSSTVSAAVI